MQIKVLLVQVVAFNGFDLMFFGVSVLHRQFYLWRFLINYFNMVCAKPVFLEIPLLRSPAFKQHPQGQDSQPLSDAH